MSYRLEASDGILTFTIDRPRVRNAVNDEVMEGLALFAERAEKEPIHFAVITAAGEQAFCSGGDLSVFHSLKTENEAYGMLNRMAEILYRIKTLPVPVIAVVNGTAVGGGCEIATACDYRLVQRKAKCGFIQGTLAITTGWGGGSYLFETLNHDKALQMLSEARLLSAEELKEAGWASELIGTEEDVSRFTAKMTAIHPDVHRAYKEMAVRKWEAGKLKERVHQEVRRCAALWEREAHHEAVNRFLSKKRI